MTHRCVPPMHRLRTIWPSYRERVLWAMCTSRRQGTVEFTGCESLFEGDSACSQRDPWRISTVSSLTHLTPEGNLRMVDVSAKPPLRREAVARGEIRLEASTLDLIEANQVSKGNVLASARLAGIMAAKRTGDLIPLCHPLPLTGCDIDFSIPASRDRLEITATVRITASTGVEMEALTAVSVAALTVYDMCKAVDKRMVIGDVRLVKKTKQELTGASVD